MTTINDITVFAGDDETIEFTVIDEDASNPLSIAGATINFRIRSTSGNIDKSIGSGITIVDGPNGRCDVEVERVDTLSYLDAGAKLKYEFQVTLGGRVKTLIVAKFNVEKNLL